MASFITNKLRINSAETFIDQFNVNANKNTPTDINLAGNFVGNNTDFITELYEYYFGRAPDTPGLNYWVNVLDTDSATRRAVELDAFLSGEGNTTSALYVFTGMPYSWTSEYIGNLNISSTFSGSNTEFVSNLYQSYYRREGDEAGIEYWVSMLDNGIATRAGIEFENFVLGEDKNEVQDMGIKDFDYWDDMIALKRIYYTDLKLVVPKFIWENNTIFSHYDSQVNTYGTNFYALNSEFNVYKCINNNNYSYSTVEPSGTSTSIITLSDGYKWKYLYNIESQDRARFINNSYMPVDTDPTVVSAATDGSIDFILLTNGGQNYNSNLVTVTITGDGSYANVQAVVTNNVITGFNIINSGNNYSKANVIINGNGQGTGAKARAIIGPKGGHGSNPKNELGAFYVMAYSKIEYSTDDFPTDANFRRIGLIKNPIDSASNLIASVSTLNALYAMNANSVVGTFQINEFIEGNVYGGNAVVVSKSSDNKYIKYIQSTATSYNNFKKFTVGELITGKTSGATGVIEQLHIPEVKHDYGDIIFVDNSSVITRSPSQSEIVQVVIKF